MSLNQLSESPVSPRRTLLPASLLAALAFAVSACNKSETPVAEVKAPVALPTGTMGDTIPTGSTQESRQAVLGKILRLVIENKDSKEPLSGIFTQDPGQPTHWRLASLSLGFGPGMNGTHMVTVRQQGEKVSVYDILDMDSDGNPDRVEYSISAPFISENGTAMSRSDKSYVVDEETNDMFAAGLNKAKEVFEAQIQRSQQGQK